MAGGITITIKI